MKRLKSLFHELAEGCGGRFDAFAATEVEGRAGADFETDVGVLRKEVEERLVEEIAGYLLVEKDDGQDN